MIISEKFRAAAISEAERCIGFDAGEITDALYSEFAKSGNRSNYERVNFHRRRILNRLVLGEICEGKGRFVQEIHRIIQAILSEKTWVLPAHSGGRIPKSGETVIDLFSSQTAAALAVISSAVAIGAELKEKIRRKISERIFLPFLNYDYWWRDIGENRRKSPSNWTPWCIHGIIECARAMNPPESAKILEACQTSLSNYFEDYPDDGGCDEGALYWEHSVGHFFECGLFDGCAPEKLDAMFAFIMRANITDDYFMNFADCSARINPDAAMIFLMGKSVQNPRLCAFGARLYRNSRDITMRDNMDMRAKINAAAVSSEIEGCNEKFVHDRSDVFGSLGAGIFRNGIFRAAAKGGHNGENHNHNDCGNFIIYRGGSPVMIDMGVCEYTADTFSDKRYSIPCMQSSYHNLPEINGFMQSDGEKYSARNVSFSENGFSCDIAGAYPDSAGILSLRRNICIDDEKIVILSHFLFEHPENVVYLNYILPLFPRISGNRAFIGNTIIELPPAEWTVVEIRTAGDEKLAPVWGDSVFRLRGRIMIDGYEKSLKMRLLPL